MTLRTVALTLTLLLALGTGGITAQDKVGTVHFATSCSAAVQQDFERAVAMLHSFWFSPSTSAFTAVAQSDPACGIAHWGVAMNLLGNPFGWPPSPKALADGWAAVERAKAAGAKTQRERDYVGAIETFYKDADKIDHRTRALAYRQAMEQLAARYPEDREATIFYALALNATATPTDKTYADQLRAARMLEKVFAKHPNHPGVAHYLIHAYDYPPIAEKGLAAAKGYADIAPSAPHALHMPSHIFTRVGLWQESASTNRRTIDVAQGEAERSDRLHALDYLVYASLQLARDKDAGAALDEARQVTGEGATALASVYARSAIPARYAIERGQWQEAARLDDPDKASLPFTGAMRYFARALGAARSGNPTGAEKDLDQLRQIGEALKAAKNDYWATEVEVQRRGAEAWIAYAKGDRDQGISLMRAAADIEDKSEKHPVSPGRLVPARELLGDMLLESGHPGEALIEYEASQTRDPRRFRGYWGAGQAATQAGNKEKARDYFTRLVEMAGSGDPRPELAKAREYLAMK